MKIQFESTAIVRVRRKEDDFVLCLLRCLPGDSICIVVPPACYVDVSYFKVKK